MSIPTENITVVKIHFNGFRSGDSKIIRLLQLFSKIFECNCVRGNLYDSDILCESVYAPSLLNSGRGWKHTFFYPGDNYRLNEFKDRYDVILSCDTEKKTTRSDIPNKDILGLINDEPSVGEISMIDKLEELAAQTGLKITYAGEFRNNTGYVLNYNRSQFTNYKTGFLRKYKFVLVVGDCTVKDVVDAQTIPLVVEGGGDNVVNLINNIRDSDEKWLDYVNNWTVVNTVRMQLSIAGSTANPIKTQAKSSIFDHIDAIFYINLASRPDRRDHFLAEIAKFVDVEDMARVHLIDAVAVKENGALGCTLSHIKTFELIEAHPEWQNCIVFEDDFTFRFQTIEENVRLLCDFFENPLFKNWDLVNLSFNPGRISWNDTVDPNVKRVHYTQTTSGYCVSRKFVPKLKANFLESAEHMSVNGNIQLNCCDINWNHLAPAAQWYLITPAVGYQYNNFSDIENRVTAYGC